MSIIDDEELREMLGLADAAYAHVAEELAHQELLKAGRPAR